VPDISDRSGDTHCYPSMFGMRVVADHGPWGGLQDAEADTQGNDKDSEGEEVDGEGYQDDCDGADEETQREEHRPAESYLQLMREKKQSHHGNRGE